MMYRFIKIQNEYLNIDLISHIEVEKIGMDEFVNIYTKAHDGTIIRYKRFAAPSEVMSVKNQLEELTIKK